MEPVEITEPAILIRINRTFRPEMSPLELYEATRGVWVMGPRCVDAMIALAVADRKVQEVYSIKTWHPGWSTPYETRKKPEDNKKNRREFIGSVAAPEIRNKYVGKSVTHYFRKGAVNPIMYVNM